MSRDRMTVCVFVYELRILFDIARINLFKEIKQIIVC